MVYSRAGLDVAVQSVGNPIERAVCQADGVEFSVAAACIDIAVCYCRAGYNGVIRVEFPTGGTLFFVQCMNKPVAGSDNHQLGSDEGSRENLISCGISPYRFSVAGIQGMNHSCRIGIDIQFSVNASL